MRIMWEDERLGGHFKLGECIAMMRICSISALLRGRFEQVLKTQ